MHRSSEDGRETNLNPPTLHSSTHVKEVVFLFRYESTERNARDKTANTNEHIPFLVLRFEVEALST